MQRYFVNVLTEVLLIHECKYFLKRQRRDGWSIYTFLPPGGDIVLSTERWGLSSQDFDLLLVHASLTQPLLVQE